MDPFQLNTSSSSELPKIGPGLGSRSTFWAKVRNRIIHENKRVADPVENEMLIALASDKRWLSMVPPEWVEIYGALYEESKYFIISESERTKIDKDIGRTFSLFERNARLLRLQFKVNMTGYSIALQNVLMAASHERGYCQGINFVAAVFLLYQANEKEAFTLLCFLLKQRYMEILYNPKCSSLLEYMNYFEKRLRKHNKRIYKYFKHIDYSPVCYSIEWFTTCFIVTCPGELSSCVLDLMLVGFDDIMIRVGLAMLDHLEDQLLKLDLETMQLEFKPLASKADPYDVMFRALTIPVPANTRQNVLKTMAQNIEVMNPGKELVNTLRVTKAEEEEGTGQPTPVKQHQQQQPSALSLKAVSKTRSGKDKKGSKSGGKDGRKGRIKKAGVDRSPIPVTTSADEPHHTSDACGDDEGANTGARKARYGGASPVPRASPVPPAAAAPNTGAAAGGQLPPISPVTPLTRDSKSFTRTPSNNRKPAVRLLLTNPQQALRNELNNLKRHRRAVLSESHTRGNGTTDNHHQEQQQSPSPHSPIPKSSTMRRKQSRPETRFSRTFIKRIPSKMRTSYLSPQVISELVDFEDIFVVNKDSHAKRLPSSPVKRTPGIGTTPTNGSAAAASNSTRVAANETGKMAPKPRPDQLVPQQQSQAQPSTHKQAELLKAQTSTRRVNNPRMLQDPQSPLNVELHEKMEARLMQHLFPPAPSKKSSSSSAGGAGATGGAVAGSEAAVKAPAKNNVTTSTVAPQKSAQSTTQQKPPHQQTNGSNSSSNSSSSGGAQWFDKVVQDTLWFTTFGLVHAPLNATKAPTTSATSGSAGASAAASNASVLAAQSRPVKESKEPPWVVKKELEHQHPQHHPYHSSTVPLGGRQPTTSSSQRELDEEMEALVWIPGTQEGYDGDVSQDDSEGEEIRLPSNGQPQSRTKRRADHIRNISLSLGNRNKMISIDVTGRSNLVEDLENPIDLLAGVEERWFSVPWDGNPAFKLLNKQYHNEANLAIRRKRNKKRSFKEKFN